MHNSKILPLIGLALAVIALIANHAISRLAVSTPHLVNIRGLPEQLGAWKAGEDRQIDPGVTKQIPTAKILDRVYTRGLSRFVDVTLVTADEREDIHSPSICLPAQGWQLGEMTHPIVDGEIGNLVHAVQDNQGLIVLYWLTGEDKSLRPNSGILQKIFDWREQIAHQDGASLMVRLIAPDSPDGERDLWDMVGLLRGPVETMCRTSAPHLAVTAPVTRGI